MCVFDGKENGKKTARSILRVKNCKGEKCAFKLTAQELAQREAKAMKRLTTLPQEQQLSIAEKYYNGKTVWND